jgi:glycosyltransferase involved in cell wall biosynthesis
MATTAIERPDNRPLQVPGREVCPSRVLILATDVFTRGGIARYTSTLASSVGRMVGPNNVDLLSFFDWGQTDHHPTEFRLLGTVSSRNRASVLSQFRFLLKAARAGCGRYDLVIANHVALGPVAALLKLAFGTPYWIVCHSIEIWSGTSRPRHAALRKADGVLAISRYTAEMLGRATSVSPSKVHVLYNAIPDSFRSLLQSSASAGAPVKPSGPFLLSVCSLVKGNEFKGVDTVIRALPKILKTQPHVQYAIVGDGELRPRLESLAAQTGVAANVIFLGEVTDEQLAALYRRCDTFVLPSRGQENDGQFGGEGFGRVYVEAALAGKPVIGSRAGGAAEAVLNGKTGFLVNPVSSDEVAEASLTLLQNPDLAAQLGRAGRTWAQATFSEEALCKSLADLLPLKGIANGAEQAPVENATGVPSRRPRPLSCSGGKS